MRKLATLSLGMAALLAAACIDTDSVKSDFCKQRPAVCESTNHAVDPDASMVVDTTLTNPPADALGEAQILVTVKDLAGRPLPDLQVRLTATGTGAIVIQPAGVTNTSGIISGAVRSSEPGAIDVSASVHQGNADIALKQHALVTFVNATPRTIDPNLSTVTVSSQVLPADGTTACTITVTVKDTSNVPIAGRTVSLAATGTGHTLTQPAAVTDLNGIARGTLTATTSGPSTITATVDPGLSTQAVLTSKPVVTFTGDPNAVDVGQSLVSVSPSTVIANGTNVANVAVTVRDAAGAGLAGMEVTFTVSPADGVFPTQPSGLTNASGYITGTFTSSKAGAKTVTVTVNPATTPKVLATTPTVTFIGDATNLDTSKSTVTVLPAPPGEVVADGTAAATLTVTARDINDNPVPSVAVTLSVSGTNNTYVSSPPATDPTGTTSTTLTSTTAEQKTITATVNSRGLQPKTVRFVGDPATISTATCDLQASPPLAFANGTATITITGTVHDALGNGVPHQTVTFTSTGTNNDFTPTPPTAVTGYDGVASVTLASIKAETKTLNATVSPSGTAIPLKAGGVSVTFVADPSTVSAANSHLTASPTTIPADNSTPSTLTATIVDANGNPLPNLSVTFSASPSAGTSFQPSATVNTNASGVATARLVGNAPGAVTVSATAGTPSVTLAERPQVTLVKVLSAELSSITVSKTTATAGGADPVGITVIAKDLNGVLATGEPVTVYVSGTGNTLTPVSGNTDGSGEFLTTLISATSELKTISAKLGQQGAQVLPHAKTVKFVLDPADAPVINLVGMTGSGCRDIEYTLSHRYNERVDVQISFDPGTGTFLPATQAPSIAADGTRQLATWASPTTRHFAWDSTADLGFQDATVTLRAIATRNGVPSAPSTLTGQLVSNGLQLAAQPGLINAGGGAIAVASADMNRDGLPDLVVARNTPTNSVVVLIQAGGGSFTTLSTSALSGYPHTVLTGDYNRDGVPDVAVLTDTAIDVFVAASSGALPDPPSFSRATTAIAMGQGDVDRDGILDLVVDGTSSVTTLLGAGDGTFPSSFKSSSFVAPGGMVVADYDRDGLLDVVAADSGMIAWVRGTGTSTFDAPVYSLDSLPLVQHVAVADFNRDGLPDVVAAAPNRTWVVPNVANIGAIAQQIDTQTTPAQGVRAVDLDGDGNQDVVVITSGEARWLRGHGDFTFDAARPATLSVAGASGAIVDLDRDGLLDVAVAGATANAVQWVRSQRAASCNWQLDTARVSAVEPFDANHVRKPGAVADFDRDGKLDVAMAVGTTLGLSHGLGDGSFGPPQSFTLDFPAASNVVAADFDNDGRIDLAVNVLDGTTNRLKVLRQTASGWSESLAATGLAGLGVGDSIATGDLNLDGNQDVVLAIGNNFAFGGWVGAVLLGNGDGTFTALPPIQAAPAGGSVQQILLTDTNVDGVPDLVFSAGSIYTATSRGDGTFNPQATLPLGGLSGYASALAAGDVDGDGWTDLAASFTVNGGTRAYLLYKGTPTGLGTPTNATLPASVAPSYISLGDLDGDGKLDLLGATGSTEGKLWTFKGTGTGFTTATSSSQSLGVSAGPLLVDDANGDGRSDALMFIFDRSDIAAFAGNGTVPMTAKVPVPATAQVNSAAAADYDNDAKADLFVQSVLSWLPLDGAGNGSFTAATPIGSGGTTVAYLAQDFNRDGRVDIVGLRTGLPLTAAYQNNGAWSFSLAATTAVGSGAPGGLAGADLNRNGVPDIVVSNGNGAQVGLGDGTGNFAPGATVAVPGSAGAPILADFDRDGVLDLALGDVGTTVSVFPGLVGGTFGPAIPISLAGVSDTRSIAAGDFDGDAKLDLAVVPIPSSSSGPWQLLIYRGNGFMNFNLDATYALSAPAATSSLPLNAISAADLDGDGRSDVAVLGSDGALHVFLSRGQPVLGPERIYAGVSQPLVMDFADFNGDGRKDLFVGGGPLSGTAATAAVLLQR